MSEQDTELVVQESATIYDIHDDRRALCGGRLTVVWNDTARRRCRNCGAVIRLAVTR